MYEWSQYRKVETLTETGWVRLPDHPLNTLLDWNGNRDYIRHTSLLGLPSGSMLLFGNRSSNIWRLKDDEWSIIGRIKQVKKISIFVISFFRLSRDQVSPFLATLST